MFSYLGGKRLSTNCQGGFAGNTKLMQRQVVTNFIQLFSLRRKNKAGIRKHALYVNNLVQAPETSIGTSMAKQKMPNVFHLRIWK